MSETASWSYTNTATVRPCIRQNMRSGETQYGEEYQIACTWTAESKMERESGGQSGAQGDEFISQHIIYTEDSRPKYLDMILLDGRDPETDWEQIRSVTEWDMSFFGEIPDYKLVT